MSNISTEMATYIEVIRIVLLVAGATILTWCSIAQIRDWNNKGD